MTRTEYLNQNRHALRGDFDILMKLNMREMIKKKISSIASEIGTPFYLYDEEKIISSMRLFSDIPYEPKKIFAATMANNNETILRLYKSHGLGVFVNSIKHMVLCKKVGFQKDEIMWTSTGMNKRQMETAITEGTMLNVDSVSQLEMYGSLNPGGKVGLRVNIGEMKDSESYAGVFVGNKSRIGIFPNEFDLLEPIINKYNLSIIGLHVYLGTQIKTIQHFVEGVELLYKSAVYFKDLEYLDLGGGFAVLEDEVVDFDFHEYGRTISDLMERISSDYGKRFTLILEPGRKLIAEAGYFITKVTDVKLRSDHKFVFVEGSSAIFPRPLMYPDLPNLPHYVLGKEHHEKLESVFICGSTTYSRDFLAKASSEVPTDIVIGDLVVFCNAGAYSYYSKTDFLGIGNPAQVFLKNTGKYEIISPAEKY